MSIGRPNSAQDSRLERSVCATDNRCASILRELGVKRPRVRISPARLRKPKSGLGGRSARGGLRRSESLLSLRPPPFSPTRAKFGEWHLGNSTRAADGETGRGRGPNPRRGRAENSAEVRRHRRTGGLRLRPRWRDGGVGGHPTHRRRREAGNGIGLELEALRQHLGIRISPARRRRCLTRLVPCLSWRTRTRRGNEKRNGGGIARTASECSPRRTGRRPSSAPSSDAPRSGHAPTAG